MEDNSIRDYTFEEFRDLIAEAESLAGHRAMSAFQYAQTLKGKIKDGGFVSMRDISAENWG
ncbi:hypothetical protein D3C72_2509960 [compost metagenome]